MTPDDGNDATKSPVLEPQRPDGDSRDSRKGPQATPMSSPSPAATSAPSEHTGPQEHSSSQRTKSRWLSYLTPLAVVLLAAVVFLTVTRNWNAWEGGRIDQVTDDAYVRGDITPLGTKVAGVVRNVKVSDYQEVHRGDILLVLDDDDYKAQVAQANAAVAAARAAIDDNRRQRDVEDSRIQKALAGVDEANAEIAAAEDGITAVQADVVRTQKERKRQEALFQMQSTTQQTVEQAVANQERYAAQLSSSNASLSQAKALLASNQLAVEAEKRTKAVLESQEAQLTADLHAKEDALTLAKVNLGYTTIAAPDDGEVGERQVRPGQLVSPGTEVIPFVSKIKWVEANYRETQLTNVKVGDKAELRIDEYPGQVVRGKVIQIAPASGSQFALLPPDNATGNFTKVIQRIPVKIALDDSNVATALRPGLSVVATVYTRH
jgi:membrane fusion protein (multidrug efflux system)